VTVILSSRLKFRNGLSGKNSVTRSLYRVSREVRDKISLRVLYVNSSV